MSLFETPCESDRPFPPNAPPAQLILHPQTTDQQARVGNGERSDGDFGTDRLAGEVGTPVASGMAYEICT